MVHALAGLQFLENCHQRISGEGGFICYMLDNGYPKEEVEAEMLSQIGRNFRWIPELVALLKSYRAQQTEYGTFENFYPRVISFFNGYADRERLRLNAVFD